MWRPRVSSLYVMCHPTMQHCYLKVQQTHFEIVHVKCKLHLSSTLHSPFSEGDDDAVYPFRFLENYDGSFEFNSTACRELRQEIMDVKVLTMWVILTWQANVYLSLLREGILMQYCGCVVRKSQKLQMSYSSYIESALYTIITWHTKR